MVLLAEIDLVYAPVPGDLVRRPLDQDLALHEHGDALREAEHEVHVVLDDEDGDVLGQIVQHLEDAVRFQRRHARGGLLDAQHDRSGRGRQRPGEHVDEGGFPGAVRTDQGMASAALQTEIDVVRHGERAEALAQAARLQSDVHGLLRNFTRMLSRMPRIPPRANITTSTSIVPMPKYQYSGNCLASRSCAIRYTTGPTKAP